MDKMNTCGIHNEKPITNTFKEVTMAQLSNLPNIGKEVERQLNEVGIENYEQLKSLGAEAAWLKIQEIDESACIHRLYALEGAILGIKKNLLPNERKSELKGFYNWNKK
ncbi:TfoX/Sxy family protein [Lachnoclostridium phytofermentans]|uniref:TfoX domain protein n=1 Tax=Lachnoclostridium phytofermentans (strain ATCC 700394 / DSM 18823 / ISDg) TaxID=357809 RepID=A9KSA6_LACP7|nr:TfoX/Sxy family protein [Lachnoclostridium phytofermentans]ABX42138.1 TfoX domain protein [Lachnoclostridium phytofermentans ISDg]